MPLSGCRADSIRPNIPNMHIDNASSTPSTSRSSHESIVFLVEQCNEGSPAPITTRRTVAAASPLLMNVLVMFQSLATSNQIISSPGTLHLSHRVLCMQGLSCRRTSTHITSLESSGSASPSHKRVLSLCRASKQQQRSSIHPIIS